MNEAITKKDLEQVLNKVLDKKLGEYQSSIIEAVDDKFQKVEHRIDDFEHRMDIFEQMVEMRFQKVEAEIFGLRHEIRQLTTTLDNFLKRLTDHEIEFQILKAEMNKVKLILKEKLGAEITL
ncbi:MAG: hypothetical protein Q7R75_00825 [bacterium]|nr:hypothetical protein [bacterium]